jgi:hypothetical protein
LQVNKGASTTGNSASVQPVFPKFSGDFCHLLARRADRCKKNNSHGVDASLSPPPRKAVGVTKLEFPNSSEFSRSLFFLIKKLGERAQNSPCGLHSSPENQASPDKTASKFRRPRENVAKIQQNSKKFAQIHANACYSLAHLRVFPQATRC